MANRMSINDVVLRFAAGHRNAVNRDFYYDEAIRACWDSGVVSQKDITRRIGYAIGSLRKKGFLMTVTKGPPAYYDITPAGYGHLKELGLLPEPTDVIFVEEKVKPYGGASRAPPKDLPWIVGRIEEVGLDYIRCKVKGCPVALASSGAIAGYILANDLLRKQCKLWLIANEVKWIEKYEYTQG